MSDNGFPGGENPAASSPQAPGYPGAPGYHAPAAPASPPAPAYPTAPAAPAYPAAPAAPDYPPVAPASPGNAVVPGYASPAYPAQTPAYPAQPQAYPAQPQAYHAGYASPTGHPGYAAPAYAPARPTNGLAVTAMVCGIAGLVLGIFIIPLLASVAAVITGHMALSQLKRSPQVNGRGMAITGLILGYIGAAFIALTIFGWLLSLLFIGSIGFLPFFLS